jgi:putative redox protein
LASEKLQEVIVEGTGADFRQVVHVGPHALVGDQPPELGGKDEGPDPYDYLLIALGTCTSMTVGLVARRQNYPLESVRVRLTHDRIHAEDCATCETKMGSLDRIQREIELTGPLTPQQRHSLFEIARICPVSRTITTEIKIEDHLAGEEAPVAPAT